MSLSKDDVRAVLLDLAEGRQFSAGALGIEQATNRILALERPDLSLQEVALHVVCPYCGRTKGNRCDRGGSGPAHPSRISAALVAFA